MHPAFFISSLFSVSFYLVFLGLIKLPLTVSPHRHSTSSSAFLDTVRKNWTWTYYFITLRHFLKLILLGVIMILWLCLKKTNKKALTDYRNILEYFPVNPLIVISVIGNFCIVIWFFCLLYFLVVLLLTFNWTDKFFLVLFFYYFANILFVSAFCGNLNIINIDVQTSFSNLELISIWNIPANKIRLSLFLNINWVLYQSGYVINIYFIV